MGPTIFVPLLGGDDCISLLIFSEANDIPQLKPEFSCAISQHAYFAYMNESEPYMSVHVDRIQPGFYLLEIK